MKTIENVWSEEKNGYAIDETAYYPVPCTEVATGVL